MNGTEKLVLTHTQKVIFSSPFCGIATNYIICALVVQYFTCTYVLSRVLVAM